MTGPKPGHGAKPHPAEPWMDKALCQGVDPEVMFPEDLAGVEEAKAICYQCPVREACLEYALVHRERHGIWGGESERERRRIARRRRLQTAS